MTTEEKARAYDKAVNKLKRFMAQGVDPLITRADVQDFFPEFKESEDERIRKGIIKFLIDVNNGAYTKSELEISSWISWLERQGTVIKDTISMDVNSETEWDDIYKFLRINLDGEKVKLLIIREK